MTRAFAPAQYDTLDQHAPRASTLCQPVARPEYMDWETFDKLCYMCFRVTCQNAVISSRKGGN